jgi:16S rRNA G966 N2-methylase RsmD
MEDRSEVLLKDVDLAVRILKRKGDRFDLILMDPPYEKGLIERTLKSLDTETIYQDDSILVIEHHRRELLPDSLGGWNLIRQRRMGDTLISILIPIL